MISSMTGYGRGEAASGGITVAVEIRSVNSRFLEISARLPRSLILRENELKELVRRKVARGKLSMLVTVDRESEGGLPVSVDVAAARAYYRLLLDLRKAVKLRETVRLDHLLHFPEVMQQHEVQEADEAEWSGLQKALDAALDDLNSMRRKEGSQLEQDLRGRITLLSGWIDQVEGLSREQVPRERVRLRERISQLLENDHVDEDRLELELALLADRLDVTEECVRFRSHNKFFLEAFASGDPAGRRLNFLIQEMNREANTIGSKSSATEIAHLVVSIKEELEKIREQLQNIE